jgi:hypothetical protein
MSPDDTALLNRVVKNAKQYYENPERMEKSIQEILDDDQTK